MSLRLSNSALNSAVEDLLEQLHEAAVVLLQDRVLGREVDRKVAAEAVVERGAGELADRSRRDCTSPWRRREPGALNTSRSMTLPSLPTNLIVSVPAVGNLKSVARYWSPIGVAADDDRLGPARHQARDVLADDRLAEDAAAENVADGAVGRAPHLLQAEFLHATLVRRDGGALDGDAVLLGGVGGVDGDLVAGLVAALDAEVVVLELHVEVGVDQLVLDELPDDAGHLVAVHLDDGAGDLDLLHGLAFPGIV